MEYDTRAYFTEREADDVNGFIIVEVNEDSQQYRVAEKWERDESDGGPTWLTYWIREAALLERERSGSIDYRKQLNDKQFEGVQNLAEISDRVPA